MSRQSGYLRATVIAAQYQGAWTWDELRGSKRVLSLTADRTHGLVAKVTVGQVVLEVDFGQTLRVPEGSGKIEVLNLSTTLAADCFFQIDEDVEPTHAPILTTLTGQLAAAAASTVSCLKQARCRFARPSLAMASGKVFRLEQQNAGGSSVAIDAYAREDIGRMSVVRGDTQTLVIVNETGTAAAVDNTSIVQELAGFV